MLCILVNGKMNKLRYKLEVHVVMTIYHIYQKGLKNPNLYFLYQRRAQQNKLEKKEFEISKQYYTIRDYNSAIKSIENFIADNPGSIYREEALYFKWLAQYEIAINSIETRIKERVTELERSLNSFLNNYPDTIFLEDLSKKINIAKQLL